MTGADSILEGKSLELLTHFRKLIYTMFMKGCRWDSAANDRNHQMNRISHLISNASQKGKYILQSTFSSNDVNMILQKRSPVMFEMLFKQRSSHTYSQPLTY